MLVENRATEFKREYTDDIKKSVLAFANTEGGELLIGVNDDGSVFGVDAANDMLLRITNAIRDSIRPDVTLFTECAVEEMDGKKIIAVKVQRGTARPYYLSAKGIRPEGVFVRQGASSVPASETAILNMIQETSGKRFETARSLNQQLTFKNATAYFDKNGIAFAKPQKKTLHLIGDDGTYTNLALLLSEQCPHTIKLAVFENMNKTIFKDRREFSGSLFEQLDEVYAFIDRYNSLRSVFKGLERIDNRDYPIDALREALLNTLVHRDYGLSPATLISIFDDRIEMITIGGLLQGISFSDIMLGVSALRNPYLADIFYRLNLIEAYGTGIAKIRDCYRNYSVQPNIELSDNAFKITLPNVNYRGVNVHNLQDEAVNYRTEREKSVLAFFDRSEFITRHDVQQALGLSQATVITLLREMLKSGLIVKEGGGKNQRYRQA
jgi:ATP-dependent DNA helicase RecG